MIRLLRLFAPLVLIIMLGSTAFAYETKARAAFVMDITTGTILLNKNADTPLPPASMSKLMTLYVAFEAIRDGRLSLEERLPVSQHAMSYKGSTMFLDTTDRVTVADLLRGIIVLSGNDASAVIAEALSPDGTEAGFARFMTKRAHKMGMTNSTFLNSNGWPVMGHEMSVRDLALLARHLIEDFPEFYPIFAETEFNFDGRSPRNNQNRNPLLSMGIGADGLKTGHTKDAGYGLVGSVKQGNRRVVFVLSGLETARDRAEEAEAIANWAFRQFTEKSIVDAGTEVARADVWMGRARQVGLAPADDVRTLMPALGIETLKVEVVYTGPIRAPVKKGDALAELVFTPEGLGETRVPLLATQDVERGGFLARIRTVSGLLLARLQQRFEDTL
jgi:D-alanyl-D-alanine carboxypeptidase (penicillin-binding protein 5/6)